MSVDWADYVPFDPGVDRPLHEVSRREARAAFQRLMAFKAGAHRRGPSDYWSGTG